MSLFGWCITGQHDECIKIIKDTIIQCTCKCHILEAEDILTILG